MKHPKSFKQIQQTGAILLLAGSLVLSSCTDPVEPSSKQSDAGSGIEVPTEPPPAANTPPEPGAPTDAPGSGGELTNGAELTDDVVADDVVAAVLQAAASSHSVPAEDLEVASATAKSWPDGCLGLGGPDEICTLAIVDGWEVVVINGDNRWVYRTDADGLAVREAKDVES